MKGIMGKIRGTTKLVARFYNGPEPAENFIAVPEEPVNGRLSRDISSSLISPASSRHAAHEAPFRTDPASQAKSGPSPVRDDRSTGKALSLPRSSEFPLVLDHAQTIAAESFSILRSRLLGVHAKVGVRSVVITSAQAADGKTLVAANLSLSLGQLGAKRVLLVDGDLRIGNVSKIFDLSYVAGLSDFLQGLVPFEAVIRKTALPSLFVAPAGTTPKKVLPELLQGPQWLEFLDIAKQKFDLIIVDTIPLSAPVVDLELLTEPCDAVLVVVRMRQTTREALKRVTARVDARKFLGVVINNADEIYEYDYGYIKAKK